MNLPKNHPKADFHPKLSSNNKIIIEIKDLEALLTLVQKGLIKPAVDSVRPLSELATSLTDLIERRIVGKAILVP